jgi:tetratricopeptide (TPR) repeat protein
MRAILLPLLLLTACAPEPAREAVTLAGAVRRDPAVAQAMADRPFDCAVRDRACATLWLARGAACARQGRADCAIAAFRQADSLTPADAPAAERAEPALRLADALEARRDRAVAAARRADNDAILAALAPLPAGLAAHYRAGVGLNRLLAGDVPPAGRCGALAAVAADVADAASAPGLPPIDDRIAQRRAALAVARAALAALRAAQNPGCP